MTDEKANFEDACREFIEVVEVKESYNFNRRLDEGEQDALTLAIQKKAVIIIDDRKGSNEAKDQNLITFFSLRPSDITDMGILIPAEDDGLHINQASWSQIISLYDVTLS